MYEIDIVTDEWGRRSTDARPREHLAIIRYI
jgi:hypothetical protein